MSKKNVLLDKSFTFALLSIQIYKELITKQEYILSKQFMRSGTSVGANIRESQNAESKKDFIHKLSISQKECDESKYWLELLYRSKYIEEKTYIEAMKQAGELLKILKSVIVTTRNNMNQSQRIYQ